MATLVCFHAHPDDEVIATGGVMAMAAAEGHRVVLVTATRGEHGEVQPGVLAPGEELWERRVRETADAAAILGVSRHEFLGYVDSGMMGDPTNALPETFWQADTEEAAGRLARILGEEGADVLTVYDAEGVYGHPDHIQVHRVGSRAAALAGTPRVYEATIDRDRMREMLEQAAESGDPEAKEMLAGGGPQMGSPSQVITTRVDVSAWLGPKRAAMRAHASQIPADSWFLAIPDDAFAAAFGVECFIRQGAPGGLAEDSLFEP